MPLLFDNPKPHTSPFSNFTSPIYNLGKCQLLISYMNMCDWVCPSGVPHNRAYWPSRCRLLVYQLYVALNGIVCMLIDIHLYIDVGPAWYGRTGKAQSPRLPYIGGSQTPNGARPLESQLCCVAEMYMGTFTKESCPPIMRPPVRL